ncbi:MAG: AAA family ATPase [Sphingomonas sp.]|uniref:AAA family ATPase n=1 Tax=Sphingomonas sp. TaxID=28214 RepID=UPI0017E828FF|nr:AAA family ATPase [Sphingomonas sp.]MBA3666619.1 AAA family ATPase [Sphingomonas sp.]
MTQGGGEGSIVALPDRARRAGERRQMTIMFYDLVGSTALAGICDPEDFSDAVEHFHHAVEGAARSLGGYVGSRVGDGAVVYFGYPTAQEDAAERAVLAGLRAVAATSDLILPNGEAASIRIGIATGEGIVNQLGDGEGGNEVVGTVANLAARLQSCAAPQSVVVSDGTRRVLGGTFDLIDIGLFEVKGFVAPVQAWRVSDSTLHEASQTAKRSILLVGRDAELATMRSTLGDALTGADRALLLIGEPGVGKSHLATAFLAEDQAVPVQRINLSCAAHSTETPLYPFVSHLQRSSRGGVAAWAPDTTPDDAAVLARFAGIQATATEAVANLTASQRLDRTIDALVRQFELFSHQVPLLVFFEDAHWADPTSLTVLDRAIRDGQFGQALLIVTARPEFEPGWADLSHVKRLRLLPLELVEAGTLVLSVPGAERLPPSVRRAILRRADGVPLFLEELTRSTVELATEKGKMPIDEFELPMSLQDSLLARLALLGPAKRIAQIASVIGRRFTRDLLASLAEVPIAEINGALDRLTESGLVTTDTSRGLEQFVFRHVLIQEAAYTTLLRADRRRLNLRLLELLEADSSAIARDKPERLAHYAAEGGNAGAAAGYWLKAGLAALANSAMPEAKARLQHGLACVAQMPDGPERSQDELKLQLALGKALIATVGYAVPETGAAFERARELCGVTGHRAELLAVLHGLWINDLLCGRLHSAETRADELLKEAEAANDPVWVVIGCRAQGVLGYPLGNFARSLAFLERGLAEFDPSRRRAYAEIVVDDPRVVMLMYAGFVHSSLGHRDQAFAAAADSVAEARLLGQPYNLAQALTGQILVNLFHGLTDGTEAMVNELADLTREHEIGFHAAVCEILRGRLLMSTAPIEQAIAVLSTGIDYYRGTGSVLYAPTFFMWLAEALMEGGQFEAASQEIAKAEAVMAETGMANDSADIAMVRGELQRQLGDVEGATTAIRRAIAIAERQGAALHLSRYRAGLASLEEQSPIVAKIRV